MTINKVREPRPAPAALAECSAHELREIAHRLLKVADALKEAERHAGPGRAPHYNDDLLMRSAQALYRARRRRDRFFESSLIGEPAWDMLLDLFIHSVRDETVSTTSLCVASGVPPTTALRWIAVLEKEGLLFRRADRGDERLKMIYLTPKGFSAMREWLTDWLRN